LLRAATPYLPAAGDERGHLETETVKILLSFVALAGSCTLLFSDLTIRAIAYL